MKSITSRRQKKKEAKGFFSVCGIYAIVNNTTGRAYIGKSENIKARWVEHVNSLETGNHHNKALQADWNKYGRKAFSMQVILTCDPERLIYEERFSIKEYRSLGGVYNYMELPS
jgi:group I intron endonuclease